ncbi:uncharacterized protein LOC106869601 [Octopus bimaculoides]|uniref:Uncharacterized protein n=1 Tax=Octopus bimaculoides TaxID=37653 RepID=A0A0L8HNB7_OCTBM|nr:uncharacterized protein LOC106869601 [Octopus bimaculoides]XP_014770893.1 uncharacterized protein LOC106869601 [Octopus bimaculoides]XP_014770894.1 uncharacterized protein LOC106869601 [Octopus bimaculoides]XP_014770895.1 uncharacterized protein LOC106869601 [Octopus bimaculoides]|eukprot:XP_014770892.1 PREDICTED: uncharacterized protein LOC106869601 [Octopus bimaculoides]
MNQSMSVKNVALILIDLQNSFITGRWMRYFGEQDITKIRSSFNNCLSLLKVLPPELPVLFTRVPFGRESDFQFYDGIDSIVAERKYKCIIKSDTNIMDADGIKNWMDMIMRNQISTVVIGGCVTTSCIRNSSSNLVKHYKNISGAPDFIVDLNLCAARNQNYKPRCSLCMNKYLNGVSDFFCGQCETLGEPLESPVDRAVSDMRKAGVTVIDKFEWESLISK